MFVKLSSGTIEATYRRVSVAALAKVRLHLSAGNSRIELVEQHWNSIGNCICVRFKAKAKVHPTRRCSRRARGARLNATFDEEYEELQNDWRLSHPCLRKSRSLTGVSDGLYGTRSRAKASSSASSYSELQLAKHNSGHRSSRCRHIRGRTEELHSQAPHLCQSRSEE